MPPIPSQISAFWLDFVRTCVTDPTPRFHEAFHFDDNEASANALAELVVQGKKRATAGSFWSLEAAGTALVKPGQLSVVTRFSGEPVCVIETLSINIIPFAEVDADFAATEGEGDGSLAYRRQAHSAYFSRECARLGRDFDSQMPVVCEVFELASAALLKRRGEFLMRNVSLSE